MVASTATRNLNCIKKMCFVKENVPCVCLFDEIPFTLGMISSFVVISPCSTQYQCEADDRVPFTLICLMYQGILKCPDPHAKFP